jgi:uncharacterized protein YxjI
VRLQFYLKPEGGPKLFFVVLDDCGRLVYEVRGGYTSIGCNLALREPQGKTIARLTGVFLPGLSRFTASSGSRRMRIWIRPDAARRAVQFRGMEWRFRGSVLTRSFDILERHSGETSLVMTHGRSWNGGHDCYAITVRRLTDVPLALCAAVAVDCAMVGGCASPVPAG